MPRKRSSRARSIYLNQQTYDLLPRPLVVICIDGCDPAYIRQGLVDGILPHIQCFLRNGFGAWAEAAVPTFTNPNNLSIVTGSPPAVHGIAGNYFLDSKNGRAVMMTDPAHLRSDTLLARFSQAGVKVVVITAKDKLCRLLGHGLRQGICFSAEKAAGCTYEQHGIENICDHIGLPQPPAYSADLSLFVLEASGPIPMFDTRFLAGTADKPPCCQLLRNKGGLFHNLLGNPLRIKNL